MSGCIERHQLLSPMTGSMGMGHLRPHEEEPKTQRSTDTNTCEIVSPHHRRSRHKMTPVPLDNEKIDQPIQLTPLWEHVVRTQEFPQEINKHSTFKEISERLRDPEWEVRQHALRVMIDVLPTLPKEQLDDILVPVVPELINNLGHLAPAVRKGALDALRVYLVFTEEREKIVNNILQANLTRQDSLDPIKTSITQGLILSMPSLLFPSPTTPQPSEKALKNSITSLSSHLIQVNHQESALKSLVKIRDTIGPDIFNSHLSDLNPNIKKDFESLSQVYGIDQSPKRRKKPRRSPKKSAETSENRISPKKSAESSENRISPKKSAESSENRISPKKSAETSENRIEIETRLNSLESQENSRNSRVVLETEIKLNEETAITMTILERKHSESSEDEGPEKGEIETESKDTWIERRKTPRRVHFGGEIVKLRTPDSDDSIHTDVPQTKIPVPIAPVTKLPNRSRPSSTIPSGQIRISRGSSGRKSRSASTSPKRGFYIHDGSLSPKKGILTKSSMNRDKSRSLEENVFFEGADDIFEMKENDRSWSFEVFDEFDDKIDLQKILSVNSEKKKRKVINSAKKSEKSEKNKINEKKGVSKSECNSPINVKSDSIKRSASSIGLSELNDLINSKKKSPIPSPKRLVYETFPRKERNYILMELSSPVKINSRSREVSPVCEQVNGEINSDNVNLKNNDNNIVNEIVDENDIFVSEKNDRVRNFDNSEDNWEELGLVGKDVLDDLHNKDDWRARVRGLERVASALRTSSALIAIEPRLGSLLQAVLGGERSCRVAAAAMSVARVVVAGVSEEALKRRLPQVAWGLSRQGGPNAAQLARIAMLRLRPALFLEQLLQPHCIDARNAKTRENALQLLIFSLVTFPSTEFKVENVANKVALMVGDRRRRVRQAALDTLAVLAQIYEPEEVLQAGNRAAKQLNEGTDMVAAIRARLARKSLPMVSADGLVVYGLQISPTIQIATGPDVDWIVAGSGSVSPGTGRSRGQIIPPNLKIGVEKKNDQEKRAPSPKPNFVAIGVGLSAKSERPVAWQLIQSDKEEANSSQEIEEDIRNESPISIETSSIRSRYDDPYSPFPILQDNPIETYTEPVNLLNLKNEKDVIMKQRKTEENFHRRMDEIYGERREDIVRLESKIPVPNSRERHIVVRHSTAYQRRRRQVDEDETQPSSAPHTSSGLRYGDFRDTDISRRYRSDRIQFSSRPPSEDRSRDSRNENSPVREGFESVYDNRRRRSVVRSSLAAEDVNNSPVDSRCNSSSHSGSMQPVFSPVQRSDPRTRRSHTPTSTRDKTNVDEEENNEKNRHYVSAQESPYHIETHSDQASQCSGTDHVPYEVSSDSSNCTNEDQVNGKIETRIIEEPSEEDNEIVNRRNSFGEKSFDIITSEMNPSRRNSIEQITANVLSSGTESTDQDKETSSDNSVRDNESDEKNENARLSASASSVVSIETNSTDSTRRISGSPSLTNGIKAIAFDHEPDSTDAHDGPDESLDFDRDYSTELKIDIESRVSASIYPETTTNSFQQSELNEENLENSVKIDDEMKTGSVNSLSIVVASRPNSRTSNTDYHEPAFQPLDFRQQQTDENNSTSSSIFHVSRTYEDSESIDVTTEKITVATGESFTELPDNPEIHIVTISKIQCHKTPPNDNGIVHDIVKIHEIETTKRLPSRVPRSRIKSRPGLNKVGPIGNNTDKTPGRSKPVTVQCISQLESSDWETTIRGLKSLSSIAKQHPEQLDSCQPGTVCRLLGRHVRNLRSQVARTACLAAGDVFTSQARCIDQDLDDIAGPLLQRTADTNKFLRADSNAALDRMIEHIPPHKTIAVIVHRGASHQNAIVRAATARLLLSVIDRIGPDFTMTLPRDVRDKLLGAGAKLLMDGNLDARNNAKMIFKKLSRCDGFRRALTDAVPDSTLRHIEKTLRSL